MIVDVLTDILNAVQLQGWLSSRRELKSPWRYEFALSEDSVFHIMSDGGAYLQIEGQPDQIRVEDGDVVLFPSGRAHSLFDDQMSPLTRHVQLDYHPDRTHHVVFQEGAGIKPLMLCGAFHFGYFGEFPLLTHLPDLIHIRGSQGRLAPGFSEIVRLLATESALQRPGTDVMLRRLTELLFIHIIRLWINQQDKTNTSWIGALNDPAVGKSLALIHHSPESKWTVQLLADEVALSRSAFSGRFSELVGEPPMAYLTRWRMLKSRRLLKSGFHMSSIAEQVGYESEVAFRKAFKREVGMTPTQYRHTD